MNDEIFEAIKKEMGQLGIADPDEILEFMQLMEKYWMDFKREGHAAA